MILVDKKYEHCIRIIDDIYLDENDVLDEKFTSIINRVKDSINTLNEEDIISIVNNYPNESLFLYLIKNCDNLYSKSISYMIKNIKNDKIIIEILNRKLNQTDVIKTCVNRLGNKKIKKLLFEGIKLKKCPFSQQVIDFLVCNNVFKYDYLPFAFTSDTKAITQYMEKDCIQDGCIWIANNTLLDNDTRNKAYEIEPNYENIYNPTDEIKEKNYRMAIETLMGYENEKGFAKEKEDAFDFIVKSIKEEKLTDSCQMDLLMQEDKTLLTYKSTVEKEIAINSSSERVLAYILTSDKCSNLYAKMLAGINKNHHNSALTTLAMRKALDAVENNKSITSYQYFIDFFIQLYSRFASQSSYATSNADEFKRMVHLINHKDIILHIIGDKNTPLYVLEKLQQNSNPHLAFLSKVAGELKKAGMSVYTGAIISTINTYNTNLPKPKDRIMDYKNSINMEIKFPNRNLKNITKEECEKIEKILTDLKNNITSPTHKRKLKLFLLEMEYNFTKEQKLDKCPFLKNENGKYNVDFEKLKFVSDKEIVNSVYELNYNDTKIFAAQCKENLKLLKRTNIVEFYSQISDIARLYNILDDAGFRDIAKIYGERV